MSVVKLCSVDLVITIVLTWLDRTDLIWLFYDLRGRLVYVAHTIFLGHGIFRELMHTRVHLRLVNETGIRGLLWRISVSAGRLIIDKRVICIHMIGSLLARISWQTSFPQGVCVAADYAVSRRLVEVAFTSNIRLDALLLPLLCVGAASLAIQQKFFFFGLTFSPVNSLILD